MVKVPRIIRCRVQEFPGIVAVKPAPLGLLQLVILPAAIDKVVINREILLYHLLPASCH